MSGRRLNTVAIAGQTMLSIELVPRDIDGLVAAAHRVAERFDELTWLNIPDIRRLSVRSHEAAIACVNTRFRVIPHVRARDRSVEETIELLRSLARAGIRDALIITGDRYDHAESMAESGKSKEHVRTLDVLQAAASVEIELDLWAAFDPYRGDLKRELDYTREKIDAGAVGLFTQPFFDLRFAEICLDQLTEIPTFIGISPVTSERNAKYWERENRVVFPPGFEMTLDYSARLSARLIELAQSYGQHAYLMPITVDPVEYLDRCFQHLDAGRLGLDAGDRIWT